MFRRPEASDVSIRTRNSIYVIYINNIFYLNRLSLPVFAESAGGAVFTRSGRLSYIADLKEHSQK
jgi:hypothetical protein